METQSPIKLSKNGDSCELRIVREFVPTVRDGVAVAAGRVIVRADNYIQRLDGFDKLFAVAQADALTFEPPIELDREDVEVVHYAGQRYKKTYGLEYNVPEGCVVADTYMRIPSIEYVLG